MFPTKKARSKPRKGTCWKDVKWKAKVPNNVTSFVVALGASPVILLPMELLGNMSPKDILHNMDDGGGPWGRWSPQIFSQRGKSHSVKGNEGKNRDLENRKNVFCFCSNCPLLHPSATLFFSILLTAESSMIIPKAKGTLGGKNESPRPRGLPPLSTVQGKAVKKTLPCALLRHWIRYRDCTN